MSIADKLWQESAAIKSLFDSQGWKMFEEKINDLLEFEKTYITKLSKNCIKPDSLHDLNFHLAKQQVLQEVLGMKEALADEFSPTQEAEQNTSETEQ